MFVGHLRNGRGAVFCFACGYGRRRASRTMVLPTRWMPFRFLPLHAWLVWCWPACLWSVDGRVVVSAAASLVRASVSRLMVGWFAVGSFGLQPALT